MQGKVVLVTGADGGLGKFVTQAFLDAGATVVGTSTKIQQSAFRNDRFTAMAARISSLESAQTLVNQVMSCFGKLDVLAHTVGGFAGGSTVADTDDAARISSLERAQTLVNQVMSCFGKLDVLAHTVGGFAGGSTVADTDDATFQKMMDVNLNSVFHMVRATLPTLRSAGSGRIIAIGSRAAMEPGAGVGAYSASKAAMVSLIKTVAAENKDAGVRANVILPGTMDTPANREAMPKVDFSKWVRPASVASLILWLASDAGIDVNGAVIPVYGTEG